MYVLYSQNCDHILILFCNVISQWISFNTFPLDLESQSVGHSAVSDSLRPQWTVARQAPLSMGFSRQEYWSALPLPSPGRETLLLGLLIQESNLGLLHCRQILYHLSHQRSNAGDPGLIPGLGRSPGEGNGDPLQYSCLEDSMNRGAWRATVHRVAKNWTWLID